METFPRYWLFVRGIHRSLVNSPIPLTKASDAELWCFPWSEPGTNGWANNRDAGYLRRHRAHYDVTVMHPREGCHENSFGELAMIIKSNHMPSKHIHMTIWSLALAEFRSCTYQRFALLQFGNSGRDAVASDSDLHEEEVKGKSEW